MMVAFLTAFSLIKDEYVFHYTLVYPGVCYKLVPSSSEVILDFKTIVYIFDYNFLIHAICFSSDLADGMLGVDAN